MKSSKIKKFAASIAICVLCIATAVFGTLAVTSMPTTIKGLQTYANGFVTVDSENIDDGVTVGITELTDNFFNPNVGYGKPASNVIIPGSINSGSITFRNDSDDTKIKIYFWAQSTPLEMDNGDKPYEMYKSVNPEAEYDVDHLKAASDKLVNDYLDLVITDPSNQTVYDGKLSGTGDGYSMAAPGIDIGTLEPGATAKYTFTLTVPTSLESFARPGSDEEDLGLDHGYENTVAMIDWYFTIVVVDAPTQTTTTTTGAIITTTTTTKKPTPPSPGTGEEPNMYLFAAIACGVSALVIFYVTFCGGKRRKKEEE